MFNSPSYKEIKTIDTLTSAKVWGKGEPHILMVYANTKLV